MSELTGVREVAGAATYVRGGGEVRYVLLHGLPLDADSWEPVTDLLPAGSWLAPDLPGLGRSAPSSASPQVWLEALLAGVTAPVVLVGHSAGTRYALRFAAAHPDRVARLVLIGPYFLQGTPPAYLRNRYLRRAVMGLLRRPQLEQMMGVRGPMLERAEATLNRPGARARVAAALGEVYADAAAMIALLAETRVPTVLVAGEHDGPIQTGTDHPVRIVPGTGHYPQLADPATVAAVILAEATGTGTGTGRPAAG